MGKTINFTYEYLQSLKAVSDYIVIRYCFAEKNSQNNGRETFTLSALCTSKWKS